VLRKTSLGLDNRLVCIGKFRYFGDTIGLCQWFNQCMKMLRVRVNGLVWSEGRCSSGISA